MTFREFWHGCWLRHGDTIWEAQHMRCLTCGSRINVLPQAVIRGPAAIPTEVRGQPLMQAKTVRVGNVRTFRQSER